MEMSHSFFENPFIEPLPETHFQGFSVKSFAKTCVDFHWHFHPEFELTYIEKGQGVRHVGRSVMPYRAGDLCLIGSNLPHAYGSHPEERTGACWTVMHFLPQLCGNDFWHLPQNSRIRGLLSQSQLGLYFFGGNVPRCVELLHRLEEKSSGDVSLAIWIELLERLARIPGPTALNSPRSVDLAQRSIDPRFQKVLYWVEENASELSVSQAGIARLVGMSPQAFCRFFRSHAGRPFHQYVNEVRIARSCSSLLNSERTISEIAYACGFNNLANFNRRFKEIAGCAPSKYRKSHGGIPCPERGAPTIE